MGWRDQLRTASFKGIKFHVADHESSAGRRLAVNEYPFRDVPYTEDLGRTAGRWQISAYMVGENYQANADRLMEAVDAGGAGALVHPYLGTKQVIAQEARRRETQREGRYVEISITFVEAGVRTFPNAEQIASRLTATSADSLIEISRGLFENGINLNSVSEFVRDAFGGSMTDAAGIFETIQLNGGINLQTTVSKINQAAEWVASLVELSNPSASLLGNIPGVAGRLISLFQGVLDLGGSKKSQATNLAKFSNYTVPRAVDNTSQNVIINNNAAITERFVRTVAMAEEAKALVQVPFASFDEAIEMRQYLLGRIDGVMADSQDDSEYDALQGLRKQVGNAIPTDAESLPRLGTLVLPQSTPSLAMTYDLYGTVTREADLIARNHVRHPGFMPGGQPLEILKDA